MNAEPADLIAHQKPSSQPAVTHPLGARQLPAVSVGWRLWLSPLPTTFACLVPSRAIDRMPCPCPPILVKTKPPTRSVPQLGRPRLSGWPSPHATTRPRPQPGALQPPCACRIAAVSRRQKRELRARAHGKGKGKSSCNVTGSELRGIMEAGAASGRSSIALSFSTGACVRSSCSDEKHDGGSTP